MEQNNENIGNKILEERFTQLQKQNEQQNDSLKNSQKQLKASSP